MKKLFKILSVASAAFAVGFTGTQMGQLEVASANDAYCAHPTEADRDKIMAVDIENCKGVSDINNTFYAAAQVLAGIVLGVGVLMIVYAGFKYATSQGDPKVTEQAKMQIVSAAIGIGIAMLAFVIVNIFKNIIGE